ncbi:hypothetical protein [Streptomyces sp. NPDC048606]|uniref:hypothetical protein n=1 Tax=Streptomyces sp. NPDC048606 TaxID=3154726 RepID=UPI00344ABD20
MTIELPDVAHRPESRAEQTVTALDTRVDADWALHTAVHGAHDLIAENHERRARAVHAAAMGLGPAGCAASAGVSEALLASWRAKSPVFDAAMASATAFASVEKVATPGRLSGMSLGLLLQVVARGTAMAKAVGVVGLTAEQLRRLRERNPDVDQLVRAAMGQSFSRRAATRGKRTSHYRLIERQAGRGRQG